MDNKNQVLRDKILTKKKHGGKILTEKELQESQIFSVGYKEFLDKGKTEREVSYYVVNEIRKMGFQEFDKSKKYVPGEKIYYLNKERSLILAVVGENGLKNGARFAIAHIDSPRVDLKPRPLYEDSEMALFKTHYYGGIKKYQWTAVPLALHGRIVRFDGSHIDIILGEDEGDPCFCITDLLPHLAGEQMGKTMAKAILGENLNVTVGSLPFKDDTGENSIKLNVMRLLNEKYQIIEEDFVSAELQLVPAFKAKDVGIDRSLIGAYGQDDRSCAYACFKALTDIDVPKDTIITVLVDKEEIGSDGNTGMQSSFLKYFISDMAEQEGLKGRDVLRKSRCLSADVNAAFDPTYSGEYEAANSCYINRGAVVTKYTGSRGKSDTSDASAEFMGEVRKVFNDANVLWQTGQLGKVDSGGGGTIAKYVANLCVDVVDVGVPVLSMHSPFELVSKIDIYMLYKAILAFLGNKLL